MNRIQARYSRSLFPWLCDFVLDQSVIARHRQALLASVEGRILEIGFGTGLNLPHYPPHVRSIAAVDPNAGMHRRALNRIRRSGIQVDWRTAGAESLPFERDTFDCVVSTWTLCSVAAVSQAVGEVHRVLKPGGRFVFFEHGLSKDDSIRSWQYRLDWLSTCLADGCYLTRNIRTLVGEQPFSSVTADEFYLSSMPWTHGYVYRGSATKH